LQGADITKNYSDASTAVVHMFHSGLWGGWQFQVSQQQTNASTLHFGYGGYQEARGSSVSSQHYFVENVLEELDAAGEWYLDPKPKIPILYFWPNNTDNLEKGGAATDRGARDSAGAGAGAGAGADAGAGRNSHAAGPPEIVIPLLDTLITVDGTVRVF
jgi:hypothetical protein